MITAPLTIFLYGVGYGTLYFYLRPLHRRNHAEKSEATTGMG